MLELDCHYDALLYLCAPLFIPVLWARDSFQNIVFLISLNSFLKMAHHQGVLTLALTVALLALPSLTHGVTLHVRPTSTNTSCFPHPCHTSLSMHKILGNISMIQISHSNSCQVITLLTLLMLPWSIVTRAAIDLIARWVIAGKLFWMIVKFTAWPSCLT